MTTRATVQPSKARTEILDAAARVIALQGFEGMSMRDLARATDRGLATLYHHFDSKDDVLAALHSSAFEKLLAAAEEALASAASAAPSERLHAFVLAHVRFVARHPDVMRVLVHEASALSETNRREIRALKARYYALGHDVVRAVIGGTYGEPEIERCAYALFGMLNWTFAWYDPARHGPPERVARTYHRLMTCGLAAREGGAQ